MNKEKCRYCELQNIEECYQGNDNKTIKTQQFNDGTIGSMFVSYNLLTSTIDIDSDKMKDNMLRNYRVYEKINYCPMCSRKLEKAENLARLSDFISQYGDLLLPDNINNELIEYAEMFKEGKQ